MSANMPESQPMPRSGGLCLQDEVDFIAKTIRDECAWIVEMSGEVRHLRFSLDRHFGDKCVETLLEKNLVVLRENRHNYHSVLALLLSLELDITGIGGILDELDLLIEEHQLLVSEILAQLRSPEGR
ncbi:MAG: hypothetical protein ACAI44_30390 [Candidatus Sericytochromatia bacterium]